MFDKAKMINQMRKLQKELKKLEMTGEAGDGKVKVTANGEQKIVSIEIDPSILNEENKNSIENWIKSATNQAFSQVQVEAAEKMKAMPGMDKLGIPGL
ncbi:YbaB/EbfC family nucleoid-associated protein [Candidatus Nomurabacteria bacterium]|nr:YbaB/EbfC family nucleoid-associated protein [Candidatus Nomurabacteria bacterium]